MRGLVLALALAAGAAALVLAWRGAGRADLGPERAAAGADDAARAARSEPRPLEAPLAEGRSGTEAGEPRAVVSAAAPATTNERVGEASAEPAAVWTLAFLGEDGGSLAGLDASVELRAGARRERIERPLDPGPAVEPTWAIEVAGWERATVEAWAPGYVPAVEHLAVRAGATDTVELAPGAAVAGRVVDLAGAPVEGAQVILRRDDEALKKRVLSRARSAPDGRFRLGTLVAGSCELGAERDPGGRAEPVRVELLPRGLVELGDVVLLGSGEIAGTVVYPGGTPAADVPLRVTLDGEPGPGLLRSQQRSDESGRFRFRGLAEGELRIEHGFYAVPAFGERGRARTGARDLLLVLEAGKLILRAEDASGAPAGLVGFELHELETEAGRTPQRTFFGSAQERIEAHVTPEVRYLVRAEGEGGEPYEAEVLLPAGETEREVVLRPPNRATASLLVDLRGPDGAPVSEYVLRLDPDEDRLTIHRRAPGDLVDGAFTGIEPGTYALELRPEGRRFWESTLFTSRCPSEIRLAAGEVARVEATAELGGFVELDLTPVPALVDRHAARLDLRSAASAEDAFERLHVFRRTGAGGFETTVAPELGHAWRSERPLAPGTWIVRVEAEGYRAWEQALVVRASETTRVPVQLVPE